MTTPMGRRKFALLATVAGLVLPASAVMAKQRRPDLVVDWIRWSDDNGVTFHTGPVLAGDNVLFQARVRNRGNAAWSSSVVVGVAFFVNGAAVSWSDTHKGLAAGASVTLTANSGPDGDRFWNDAPAGSHTIMAHVDDVNRLLELSETNNTRTEQLVVEGDAAPPGDPTVPPGAASVGYTRLAFSEDFNGTGGIDMADSRQAGFNFYRHRPFGGAPQPLSGISVSNSVLTINSIGGPNYGIGSTCGIGSNQWVGKDFANGCYFEASIAVDPTGGNGTGWPSFWSMASEHLWASSLQNDFVEIDVFEKLGTTSQYVRATHGWDYPGPSHAHTQFHFLTPGSGYNFNTFHTYGCLWHPGNKLASYRDNVLVVTDTYSSNPWFSQGDDNRMPVILGGDGWPMMVDWVRVWQQP